MINAPSNAASTRMDPNSLGASIMLVLVLALPVAAMSDLSVSAGWFFFVAKAAIGGLLLLVLFLPPRYAVLLLLMLGLVCGDGVADASLVAPSTGAASIWLLYLGPIRPSWLIFTCIFCQLIKVRRGPLPRPVKRVILWFASVPVVTGFIYGWPFVPEATAEAIIDLKFIVMLVATIVLFLSVLRAERDLFPWVLAIIVGSLLARHMLDVVYVFSNRGPEIVEGVTRGSIDSAKGAVILIAYFGITLFLVHRRWLSGALIASFSMFALAAYGTRMLWLTFALGAIILLSLFNLRRRVLIICVAAVLFVTGGWLLTRVNPETAEVARIRFLTMTEGREKSPVDVEWNLLSRIDPIRYGEILNTTDTMRRRHSYLWGSGYGSYYEDTVVRFPDYLGTSFPDYSFMTGKFYRAHEYVPHVLFKFGLVGLWLVSALWIIPGYNAFRVLRDRSMLPQSSGDIALSVVRCIVAFLITSMLQLYWSGKGLFISGVLIAICIEFLLRTRQAEPGVRASAQRPVIRRHALSPDAGLSIAQ